MTINLFAGAIELTKSEAKAASVYGSEAYKALMDARRENPGFTVIVKKDAAKKRDNFRGLDFTYMEQYIKSHNDSLMDEFMQLRALDEKSKAMKLASKSYGEIRMWFLANFPEFEEYTDNVEKIIERARAAREAKKAS